MSALGHRSTRAAARLGLLAGGLLAGFALAEAAARVALPRPQRVVVRQLDDTGQRLERERAEVLEVDEPHHPASLFVETPTGRRLRANSRVTIESHVISGRRVELRTNSVGYRNPEIGAKRGTRLLFLGDSITLADYLEEEETFVRLVERRARAKGDDWETINAGVTAIGTTTELAILIETGLSLDPDVVVLGYFLNDHETSPGVRVRPMPALLERSYLLAHLNAAATQALAWAGISARPSSDRLRLGRLREEFLDTHPTGPGDPTKDRAAFNARIARRFSGWGASWSPRIWERMQVLLREFKRLAADRGFRLRFVIFPVKEQVEAEFLDDYPQRRFAEIARDLDVPALDVLPAFRQAYQSSPAPLLYDFCHHTLEGSRVATDAIFAFLERNP